MDITNCPTLIRCFQNEGFISEAYAYTTVRGNSFSNEYKQLDYNGSTSIVIAGVTYTPEPTVAPTVKPTVTPTKTIAVIATPTPSPKPTATPVSEIFTDKTGTYGISGSAATFLSPAKSAKTVAVPDTVTVNGKKIKVTVIAASAFYNDKKLTTVTIGKNVKTIGDRAFENCAKLKTVKGGAAVASIGKEAFYGCSRLKTISLSAKLTTIGEGTFQNCKALTAVTLPSKVKSIGKNAFSGCKKLKSVSIKTTKLTEKNVGENAFKGIASKATFQCPKKKLKAYKALLAKVGAPKKAAYK